MVIGPRWRKGTTVDDYSGNLQVALTAKRKRERIHFWGLFEFGRGWERKADAECGCNQRVRLAVKCYRIRRDSPFLLPSSEEGTQMTEAAQNGRTRVPLILKFSIGIVAATALALGPQCAFAQHGGGGGGSHGGGGGFHGGGGGHSSGGSRGGTAA